MGRTPWCQVPREVVVVGSLLDLDAERLVEARPSVVLVQPAVQGMPDSLRQLATDRGWRLEEFHLDSLSDVRAMVVALPSALCEGESDGELAQYEESSLRLLAAFDRALAPIEPASKLGRTLILLTSTESSDPLAFGTGTYLADALAAYTVENALRREGYPALSWESIVAIAPDTVVLLGRHADGASERLLRLVPSARRVPVDAPSLLQPGGGMIEGLSSLRAALVKAAQ